jgi:hypothetical protein
MYLNCYTFVGDPAELTPAYDRLAATIPAEVIELQVCVVGADRITVLDACPTREIAEAFAASPEFRQAVTTAGLPHPTVVGLGEVHRTRVAPGVVAS